MRILFISNVFPNARQPGKGTFNFSLMQAMARHHQIRVVSPMSWAETLRSRLAGSKRHPPMLEFDGSAFKALYPTFYYPPKILHHCYGEFLWNSIGTVLLQVADELMPDAIVAYWAHPDGEVAVRLGEQLGLPVVVMVGGTDVLKLARQGKRRKAILETLGRASKVVSVSEHIRSILLNDGLSAEDVQVIRRGIDRALFHPGDRRKARMELNIPLDHRVLIAVGRLVPVKGFAVLIEASRQLQRRSAFDVCYVLGDGPLRSTLTKEVAAAGLEQSVQLLGRQSQRELANWYRAADLIVAPSYSEGVPNVLLESMACRLSFVASHVGGIPEIADPNFDRLVPPGDPEQLAEAIADRLSIHQPDGPRRFRPQSWDESSRQLCGMIESLCTEASRTSLEPAMSASMMSH